MSPIFLSFSHDFLTIFVSVDTHFVVLMAHIKHNLPKQHHLQILQYYSRNVYFSLLCILIKVLLDMRHRLKRLHWSHSKFTCKCMAGCYSCRCCIGRIGRIGRICRIGFCPVCVHHM